jgi:Tol biopolymer transport system component
LDPAISPSGKMVAYAFRVGTRTDIYVKSLDGSDATNVTKDLATTAHRWPRWSPDGLQLAFLGGPLEPRMASFESEEPTIYVLRFPGGQPKPITRASMRGYAWSPDGTKLVFVRGREIYISSIDGSGLRRIAEALDPNAPSWSPDGRWIAYVSGNVSALFGPSAFGNLAPSSIAIVSTNGGDARELTDKRTNNTSPVWMPDSRSLLFVSNRGGSRDVFELKLSDSGNVLGEPRRITTGLNALSIDLSKDGRQLAYSLFLTKANLWSRPIPKSGPISPSDATPLTTGAQTIEGVRVTRDGSWIVFDSNRSGNQDIYKMSRRGGTPQQLTTDPSEDFLPSWSPDAKSIAFHSFRNGNRDIYVMNADGTNQQQITSDQAHEFWPDWSLDGQNLTFYSNKTGHNEVYVVSKRNAAWRQPQQVTSSKGAQVPRWSPDGRTIAYVDVVNGVSVISPTGQARRHLVPMKPLYPKSVAWGNDNQTIYFNAGIYQASLWSVPVSGGSPSQLVQFDDSHNFARLEFDTDGKDFFFTMTERESDIWVLQLRK